MALSSDSAFVQVNVRYRVQGLKEAERQVKKTTTAMAGFGKVLKQVSLSLIAFKAFDTFSRSVINSGKTMITFNAILERSEAQLRVFTGSATEAASLMDFLRFQSTRLAGGIQDMLGASTALQTFGLNTREFIELVADVATATNRQLEDVAIAMGRIIAGDPRTKQFLVTRRGDIAAFSKALDEGKSRAEATKIAFGRLSGTSQELQGTFFRLTEQLGDLLSEAAGIVGKGAFEKLRGVLRSTVDALEKVIFTSTGEMRGDSIFIQMQRDLNMVLESANAVIDSLRTIRNILTLITPGAPGKGMANDQLVEDMRRGIGEGISQIQRDLRTNQLFFFPGEKELNERFNRLVLGLFGLGPAGQTAAQRGETQRIASDTFDKILDDFDTEIDKKRFPRIEKDFQNRERIEFLFPVSGEVPGFEGGKARNLMKEFDDEFRESVSDRAKFQLDIQNNVNKELSLLDVESERAFLEGKRRGEEQLIEDLMQKRIQAFQRASSVMDRIIPDAGFVLFGGKKANANIDKQIARIQEEVDVMEGVTAPLTRQEELMNRIVELEAQRITMNERIGSIVRSTLEDLGRAVAKAAVLRAVGFGTERRGQSGGFGGLLKFGLGLAQFVPGLGPTAQAASLGANLAGNIFEGRGGASIEDTVSSAFGGPGGPTGMRLNKPVIVNNPIFLSNDVRNVSEKFAVEAERRMR